jgi:peptidoglycan/LPS O-acetylase OafA/YrhL
MPEVNNRNESQTEAASALLRPPVPLSGFNRTQVAYLDVVRGVAAQLVLIEHCGTYFLPFAVPGQFGNLGVTVFFLLSGFLIADSIRLRLEHGQFSLTEFMVSRFTRIFMPYLPSILVVALLDWFSAASPRYEYGRDLNGATALANMFMLQDFSVFQLLRRLHVPDQAWFFSEFGSGRQFWTISIEWWIYVAVGIATSLAISPRRRPILMTLLCLSAIEPMYNLVGGPGGCLTGFWVLGAGANALYRRYQTRANFSPNACGLVGAGLTALATLRLLFTHFVVFDPVFVLILAALLFLPVYAYRNTVHASVWSRSGLNRLAFHSYSLYLTHNSLALLIYVFGYDQLAGWLGFWLTVLLSNLVAIPFAYAFEKPQRGVRNLILNWLSKRRQIIPETARPFRYILRSGPTP